VNAFDGLLQEEDVVLNMCALFMTTCAIVHDDLCVSLTTLTTGKWMALQWYAAAWSLGLSGE
jgi:hypothetical protein